MRDLSPASRERLVAVLERLTGTGFDGEAVACVAALRRLREREGWAWADVIRPPQSAPAVAEWRDLARAILLHPELLSPRDADFLANLARRRQAPTEKQRIWLDGLADRARAAGVRL